MALFVLSQLWDFMLVTPAFHEITGQLIGTIACTCHITDVGGIGYTPDATDVHMEGLYVPMLKLVDQGVMNETLMGTFIFAILQHFNDIAICWWLWLTINCCASAIIKQNTRQPVETEGDLYSLMNCNEVGRRRLVEMMNEYSLTSLEQLSEYICSTSEAAGEICHSQ